MQSLRSPYGPASFASSADLEARLESEYSAHVAIMDQRLDEALRAAGYDGAIIFAGDEKMLFRDDQAYPFRVEPYFNAWVPLTDVPGSFLRLVPGQRPMLVYKQVEDYWHEPPSDPSGYWTSHFDIRVVRTDAEALKLSGAGPRWVAVGETAGTMAQLGTAASQPMVNDPKFLQFLDFFRAAKTHYEILCMRGAQLMAARGHKAVAAAFGSGVSEFELQHVYLSASEQRETEPAVRQHRRDQRACGDPSLPALAHEAAVGDALAADRRGGRNSTATRRTSRAAIRPRPATTSPR